MATRSIFSAQTDWETAPNPLTKLTASLQQEGRKILDLTVTNPTRCSFHYLSAALLEPLRDSKNLSYDPDPHGLPEARKAVCDYYAEKGVVLSPDQVFITASTSEAYSFVFRLITQSGDSIFAPAPSYPLLDYLASLHDLKILRYPLLGGNDWKIDFSTLGGLQKARAFLLVHPNNPTGNYVTREEKQKLIHLISKTALPLIADEVFFDFPLANGPLGAGTFAVNGEGLTFTLSGISKTLGMPQMKLSWIIVSGPETERRKAIERLEIIADTYLSVSTPIQNALPAWMKLRPLIQTEILKRIRGNFAFLKDHAGRCPSVKLFPSQGGWSAVLEFSREKTDEAWASGFLKQKDVLLHPGYLFDFPAGSFLVASLLTPPEIFQEGNRRIL